MKMMLGGLLSGPDRTVGRSGTGAFWENAVGQAVLDDALRAREFHLGRPCDLPGWCLEHVSVVVVRPLVLPVDRGEEVVVSSSVGRAIGLDVHRDFCEVAICEAGRGGPGGPGGDPP